MRVDEELKITQEIKSLLKRSISDLIIILDDFSILRTLIDIDIFESNVRIIQHRLQNAVNLIKELKDEQNICIL